MMEMDDPGEASGESGGSVESVGKDVQAYDVCCDGIFCFGLFYVTDSNCPVVDVALPREEPMLPEGRQTQSSSGSGY